MNPHQAQPPVQTGPPVRRPYRPYLGLFVIGGICLAVTVALVWLSLDMAGAGTAGGLGSGDTEGGGLLLFMALFPVGMEFIFFISGRVSLVRTLVRQPPAHP